MTEELHLLLSKGGSAALILAPSMIVGVLLIVLAYRLFAKLGARFLDTMDRQAAAFEKIADNVSKMRSDIESNSRLQDDVRITLAAMASKLDHIYEMTTRRNNGSN